MRDRKQQRGQTMVEYAAGFALFVTILLLLGYYAKGAIGDKYRTVADQFSTGQFDPKRGTFNMSTTTNVTRNETTGSNGITTSNIANEKSDRNLVVDNTKPSESDKLFDAKW